VALAIPNNLTVVQRLNRSVVAVSTSKGGVLSEKVLDGGKLLLGDAKSILHDEVLNGFTARRSSQTSLVGEILAMERFLELVKIDKTIDLAGSSSSGGGIAPVNVIQEPIGETTLRLNIEENCNKDEIIQA